MSLDTETRTVKGIDHIYSWDETDPKNTRQLVFKIDAKNDLVEFYPRGGGFPTGHVVFEGFKRVPSVLSEAGYVRTGGVQYYVAKMLATLGVQHVRVTRSGQKLLQKAGKGYRLALPYKSFVSIIDRMKAANSDAQFERRAIVDSVFHDLFPRKVKLSKATSKRMLARFLGGLNDTVIAEMSGEDVERVLDFTRALLERKYTRADKRRQLFAAAKLKVDDVALSEIIAEFESLLLESPPESKWGDFLRRNLFLIESRYVHVLEKLNVVLGGSREVDFGLIDSAGFLDLFEIKTPGARLLSSAQDRGNHFWHADAVKAVVQAEKYLHNASQNALTLADGIRRQRGLSVRVIRPRAVVIIGQTRQLDTEAKAEDFRVLRTSLKNTEIVLYDELLQSLKNQKGKWYLD